MYVSCQARSKEDLPQEEVITIPFLDESFYRFPRSNAEAEDDLRDFEAIAEFNTGVALGILFPFSPVSAMYRGEDTELVATQTVAGWMLTELGIFALGGAPFGATQMARSVITRYALSNPVIALPAAVVSGTQAYIGTMEKLQPDEPTHRPSFWNSIGAAMGGTFGGIRTGDYS